MTKLVCAKVSLRLPLDQIRIRREAKEKAPSEVLFTEGRYSSRRFRGRGKQQARDTLASKFSLHSHKLCKTALR